MSTLLPYLWRKPDTAHPYDDEFEGPITFGSGSDGGWWYENNGTSGSYATTAIDKYTAYNSGDMRVHINETHTPSWLRMQPPQDSNRHILKKQITFPTNMLVYCRFRFTQHIGNTTNDNPRFNFAIVGAGSGGAQEGVKANYITMEVDNNAVKSRSWRANGGGSFSQIGGSTTHVDSMGQALEYFALHKIGTTYHYWTGTESNWIYIGYGTNDYTPVAVSLEAHTDTQDHIFGVDFVRFIETDEFPF